MKVAITGSTGLIGSRIIELLSSEIEFVPILHHDLDITNSHEVTKKIESLDFSLFLHLAAYTNVDGAETDSTMAYKINVEGTKNIFNALQNQHKKMIYISTDFVFDGTTPPFFENSLPNPISYYGKTKLQGEQALKGNAMIVRPAYPYRKEFNNKKDFVRTIKSLLEQGTQLKMVDDSLIVPTFIDDICFGLKYLIQNYKPEIFHLVGASAISPFQAGKMIARNWNLDENLVQPISYDEYFKDKAKRPQYSDIRSNKNSFYKMKTFEEGLSAIK